MKKSTFVIPLLAAAFCAGAQIAPAWVRFPAAANYQNYDAEDVGVGVDTLGNIYTAASITDTSNNDMARTLLVKHNAAGVQQWIKFYDSGVANYEDSYVVQLLVDKAGNSYLCGYGYHNNMNTKDFMVLKYDNAGTQQWVKYWDGGQNDYDYITCATFDAAGNIVVAGYANTQGATWDDLAVVKWSTAGTLLWSYVYNNSPEDGEDRALAVTSDVNNNIFVTGSSYQGNARDMITIKLNSAGTNQWTKRVPHGSVGDDDRGYSIAADLFGNAIVTGAVDDWVTIKYDPSGNVLWNHAYTTNTLNRYTHKKVLLDRMGNVIVGGDAFTGNTSYSDLVIFKLDQVTGNESWDISLNNAGIDTFEDLVLDTSNNIYSCGYFEGPLGTDMSAMILTSAGTLVWNTTYSNGTHATGRDAPYKMAVDRNRNVILGGTAETRGSGSEDAVDVITLKYDALVVGIHEQSKAAISLQMYPNPTRGQLTVKISDPRLIGTVITISNLTGQVVKEEKLQSPDMDLNLETLAKGMYLVNIKNGNAGTTKKLVIE